jgi:hypothetical protein
MSQVDRSRISMLSALFTSAYLPDARPTIPRTRRSVVDSTGDSHTHYPFVLLRLAAATLRRLHLDFVDG